MSFAMIGSGLVLLLSPGSMQVSAFHVMLELGFNQWALGPFFLVFGIVGVVALYHNGAWPTYGPPLRALRCLFGAVLWFQLCWALVVYGLRSGAFPVGVAVYFALLVSEGFSVYRTAHDVPR